jgi:predicted RNA-binding protein with PUA-like domain
MNYWLCKSEPEVYSIDDLKKDGRTLWDCVRNYQARNYLRQMAVGDEILFYHSSSTPPGVAGTARVSKLAVADPTQFDHKSDYFDEKATRSAPRWFAPEFKFISRFKNFVALDDIRRQSALQKMVLLQRGSRLSVQPVTKKEFESIVILGS